MTAVAPSSFASAGDAARAAELRRVKALATLVLGGTLALSIAAKTLLHVHPAFGLSWRLRERPRSAASQTGTR